MHANPEAFPNQACMHPRSVGHPEPERTPYMPPFRGFETSSVGSGDGVGSVQRKSGRVDYGRDWLE